MMTGRRERNFLKALVVTTALTAMTGFVTPVLAQSAQGAPAAQQTFNIPAQPLASALTSFGQQSGLQVSVDSALVRGIESQGLSGPFTREDALKRLLSGTGLAYTLSGNTVSLQKDMPVAPAAAPQEGKPMRLDPVQVEDKKLRDPGTTEGTGSYTTGAVTIGKTPVSLREIPQSVSIITRQRLDDLNLTDVGEALRYTTGMTVQSQGGVYTDHTALARGAAADYQYDGMNLGIDSRSAQYDLAVYDRVEVLRGPAGLFKGAGSTGATINLVRKRAQNEFQLSGAASGGSWGTFRIEADTNTPLNESGTARGRVVAMGESRGSFLDDTDNEKALFYGTLEFDVTEDTTLAVGGTYQAASMDYFFGLPAYATGQLADVRRSKSYTAPWAKGDLENADFFVDVEHRLRNGGFFKGVYRHTESSRAAQSLFSGGGLSATGMQGLGANRERIDNKNDAVDGYVSMPVDLWGQTHNILVGADYSKFSQNTVRRSPATLSTAGGVVSMVDFFTFDPASILHPDFDNLTPLGNSLSNTESYGVYSQVRIKPITDVTVIGGIRASWRDITDINRLTSTTTRGPDISGEVTPYAAAVWDATSNISFYGSFAEIFQPQNAFTVAGQLLPPVVGRQYEAGVKGEFLDKRLNAHAAIYRMIRTNEAVSDPNNVGSSLASGKRRAQGIEAEVTGEVMPGWNLTTGYAYTTTKILAATAAVGAPFAPTSPKHNFNLSTVHKLPENWIKGLEVGAGVKAVSGFYSQVGAVRFQADSYATVSTFLGYQINEHFKATFNVENLFDKTYYIKVGSVTANNYYGPPRNVMFTLRATY